MDGVKGGCGKRGKMRRVGEKGMLGSSPHKDTSESDLGTFNTPTEIAGSSYWDECERR